MISQVKSRYRLIPPKVNAILMTLIFLVPPLMFLGIGFGLAKDNTVTVNGVVVTGAAREQTLAEMNAIYMQLSIPMVLIALWSARRVLPRSPLDYFEMRPEGLIARGVFGTRQFPWHAISEISIRVLPARVPFAWMTIRSNQGRVDHIYMGGYIRIKLFSDLGQQAGTIADWFEQLKAAYVRGNPTGSVPPQPEGLIGKMIPLNAPASAKSAPAASVIERR